jgi:hypothetical protein
VTNTMSLTRCSPRRSETRQGYDRRRTSSAVAEANAQAFGLLATGDSEWQTKDVSDLLGVPSRTFEQFVRDHAAAFTADELARVA